MDLSAVAAYGLAALLLIAGVGHFVAPDYFQSLVPDWLPRRDLLVAVTGAVEMLVAGLLARPPTRALAAVMAAALIAVYLVSHLDAARLVATRDRHAGVRWLDRPAGVTARIAVNLAYLAWALAVALTA